MEQTDKINVVEIGTDSETKIMGKLTEWLQHFVFNVEEVKAYYVPERKKR